ncbi:2-hydroxy-3-oxopropionate reductase [Sporosarcina sp. GW1-11]|uniref:2-hydroxy-3-oxopropionate reductase n=1 Tax=Sporosarcina sp. GW1-11 TaxID=2899126 RepID=UPI00294E4180|nr:2-hydroxy-3-oxopropionate reductase [Sporosarcina sp. GW1-11]MDV6378326.1 2-hydroxy-3-oxopropionate reductase [Sporosarcina sp. GW1-11]
MKIGFIGLGIMGRPMVLNILHAGFNVKAFDLSEEARKVVADAGAVEALTPGEAAVDSDIVITMLPNAAIVRDVLFGANGISNTLRPGAIVIDMSSVSPADSVFCANELKQLGIGFMDAPVSGGEPKAIDGTLAIMVGGEETDIEKVRPVLQAMAADVTHVGGHGSGSTTKLANQILVNVTIAAMSEAVVLASKAGVDIEKMYEAIRGGLAGSAVLDAKIPLILERNFKAGGRIDINMKDLTNVVQAGRDIGVPMPLTTDVLEMFHALKVDGKVADDHVGLIQYYEKLANFEVPKRGK